MTNRFRADVSASPKPRQKILRPGLGKWSLPPVWGKRTWKIKEI